MDDLIAFLRARLDEDELWAMEASRRHDSQAHPGGVHWQWVNPETDTPVTVDPSRGPFLTDEEESYRFSLRSKEQFPTGSVGLLPQFAIHSAEEIPFAAAGHIVRHDPARVLAEVDAKRRVLASYAQAVRVRDEAMEWVKEPVFTDPGAAGIERWNDARDVAHFLDPVVRLLALPYASHPDYRDTWRP
ncbi:DUF6221 family protein [Streptomyces cinereoruber]|uniref:DUF6221 family protein n=1 Tax=Streptomyces cinereoruber TaxID=67260 RepID=UPI003641DD86